MDSLRKQLGVWLKTKVIAPVMSPWGAALVAVLKKDSSIRWAADFRVLNRRTVKDSYPIQNISYNFSKLGGSRYFSLLDGCGAFHTLPLDEDSQDLTTFVSPLGTYKFLQVPFGLQGSPGSYARFVDMVMSQANPDHVLDYLDNVLIHAT